MSSKCDANASQIAIDAKKMAHAAQQAATAALKEGAINSSWIAMHEKACEERWETVKTNSKDIKDFMKFIATLLIGLVIKLVFFP